MVFLLLIGLIIACILIGIGIIIGLAALFILFVLVSLGVISTSVYVGLYQRSFQKGFKVLILLTTTLSAMAVGMVGLVVLNQIQHWFSLATALGIGAVSGMVAGVLLGLLIHAVVRKVSSVLYLKYRTVRN